MKLAPQAGAGKAGGGAFRAYVVKVSTIKKPGAIQLAIASGRLFSVRGACQAQLPVRMEGLTPSWKCLGFDHRASQHGENILRQNHV